MTPKRKLAKVTRSVDSVAAAAQSLLESVGGKKMTPEEVADLRKMVEKKMQARKMSGAG